MRRWLQPITMLALALSLGTACAPGSIEGNARGGPSGDPGSGNAPGSTPPGNNNNPPSPSNPGGGGSGPMNGGNIPPATPPADGGVGPPPGAAPGPADPAACTVAVVPLTPPRLLDLLFGSDAQLRLLAKVSGPSAPAQPSWTWTVRHEDITPIDTTRVSDTGDVVEVPLRSPGRYVITVSAGPGCASAPITATALPPAVRMTRYWARITPRTAGLPTQEDLIEIGGKTTPTKTIALRRGDTVTIDPTDGMVAIKSFIRVSSPQSSVRFEGNNDDRRFSADLDPRFLYDVLVVPYNGHAPALIQGRRPAELRAQSFMLDAGVLVQGAVRAGADPGTPLPGARVLLRAGALPSTVGTSGVDGGYQLRVRAGAGTFQPVVLPPVGSGLPEARLPAGESLAIAAASTISFRWNRPPSAPLTVAVVDPAGAPVRQPARVRIEAEAPIIDAGVFDVELAAGRRSIPAVGSLRLEAKTDADGLATFPALAAGRYRATVFPGPLSTDLAPATAIVTAGAAARQQVTLPRPVTLRGQLSPVSLSSGLRVLATDEDDPVPGEALTATVDDTGMFSFRVAPGRSYRLQIEPAQERKLPRLFLGPTYVGTADTVRPPLKLSEGVTFVGMVTMEGLPVADAVVQLFCTGAPPDCVGDSPQLETARPLAETKTGADGHFQAHLPDPARWDL